MFIFDIHITSGSAGEVFKFGTSITITLPNSETLVSNQCLFVWVIFRFCYSAATTAKHI